MSIVEKFVTMDYGPAPEDPREALAWLDRHKRRFGHFINGAWQAPLDAKYFDTTDPSTTEKLADIAQGSVADIDAAVKSARAALPAWQSLSPHARARYLYALARQVQKHSRRLAVLETLDNGKPIRESRDIDIPLVARHFYHHAGWAQLLHQEFPGYTACGVVGQIIPWNFPLLMLAWKIAPALASGNTVVLKPAEFTPLTALAFAEICQEIDLPPGVVNIVTGDGSTGEALVAHPDVDKIAFTGSTEVGKLINRSATDTLKRVSLELGGKSPVIVLPDADVPSVIGGAANAIFFNAGQVCCAGTRLYVHSKIFDQVVEGVSGAAAAIKLGPGLEQTTQMGPLVSKEQQERVLGYIDSGKKQGASITVGGEAPSHPGYFVKPTVMVNVKPDMKVVREEIFGPVLVAQRFDDLDAVVAQANDTPYGLAASVWTSNLSAAHRLVPRIKAGTVWVNCHNLVDPNMPFGGYKQSGFGREHGRVAVEMYTEQKSVCISI
jgi:aldehyde dehydrogenase (NAD+)